MPEHHARRFFLGMEEVQALADLAMVALFRFFNTLDISRQLLFISPSGAINALQLLVLGIAAPVGARQLGQLECLEETGIRHVRAAAHVDVFFVVVQAHGLFIRHVFDQAQLVVFTTGLEQLDHLSARGDLLDHIVFSVDQLLHALLDRRHVFHGERTLGRNVVIEAFINHRPNHHLGRWIQLLYGMTDQVRTGVPNDLQTFLILGRNDLQRGIGLDQIARIYQLAVDLTGHRSFGQTSTNRLRHLKYGYRVIE